MKLISTLIIATAITPFRAAAAADDADGGGIRRLNDKKKKKETKGSKKGGAETCVSLTDNEEIMGCNGVSPYKPSVAMDRCNGHGIFPDTDASLGLGGECLCDACYEGKYCENRVSDEECVVSPIDPELRFYDEWYESKSDMISIFYGSYGMRYRNFIKPQYSDDPPPEGKNNPMRNALYKAITAVHELAGNVDLSQEYHIIAGMGAHQLIGAAVNALSRDGPKTVFAQTPSWSRFREITRNVNTQNATWWERNEGNLPPDEEDIIELMTHPNNPDNKYPEPRFKNSTKVFDLVYYWPNQQHPDVVKPRSDDIMLFSMSKIGSMADLRFGWAFVKDKAVADRMYTYISDTIQSPSGTAVFRTTKVLQAIANSKDGGDNEYFQYGYKRVSERFHAMKGLVEGSEGKFTLVSDFGVFFIVKCNNEEDEVSCQALFKSVGIKSRPGTRYGYDASESNVMTCIGDNDQDFKTFYDKFELLAVK